MRSGRPSTGAGGGRSTPGRRPDAGGAAAPRHYRVTVVEPDRRERTGMAIRFAVATTAVHGSVREMLESLPGGAAVVAVFGPGMADEEGLAEAEVLCHGHPEIGVVLVTSELSTDLLQRALRAGVRDALTTDAEEVEVRRAVERVGEFMVARRLREPVTGERPEPGRVIVAFSTKGGVGKSVIATNVAVGLSREGSGSVVIVDADLQFGDVAVLLDVLPTNTTLDAAAAMEGADAEMMDALLSTHEATGMRVLPAPIEPSAAEQITSPQMLAIVHLLRTMFRYVVVDLPPHFDDLVLSLLEEADEVLMVASMDIPSIKNLRVGMQTLDLLSLAGGKLRLVLNRADAKVNLEVADVEKALGVQAEFRIPSDIAVPQAVNRGIPVTIDKPRSAAAVALGYLAESFLDSSPEKASAVAADGRRRSRRRLDKRARG